MATIRKTFATEIEDKLSEVFSSFVQSKPPPFIKNLNGAVESKFNSPSLFCRIAKLRRVGKPDEASTFQA
jgi:hypothetical protein